LDGGGTTPYSVQSGYRNQQEALVSHLEWCRDIWDLKVPGSAQVFGLRAWLNILPSRVNLERRGL